MQSGSHGLAESAARLARWQNECIASYARWGTPTSTKARSSRSAARRWTDLVTQDKTVAGRSPAKSYELSRPRPMPDSFRYASPYPHVPPAKEQPGGMFAEARK